MITVDRGRFGTVRVVHLLCLLDLFLEDLVSLVEVEEWAGMVRALDVGYEEPHRQILRTIVFELANPGSSPAFTKDSAQTLVELLANL